MIVVVLTVLSGWLALAIPVCLGRPQLTSVTLKLSSYISAPGILKSIIHNTSFPQIKSTCRGKERDVEARAASSSERRGSATLSRRRRRHCALRRGAGLASSCGRGGGGRRSSGACGAGSHCRSPSDPGRAASPEPSARRSPPREGGWAAAWGGVSRPPQWLPRSQVDRRSPPPPGLRAVTSATQSPGLLQSASAHAEVRARNPGPPVLAPRRLPKRSESRAWRAAQPGTRSPSGSPGSLQRFPRPLGLRGRGRARVPSR